MGVARAWFPAQCPRGDFVLKSHVGSSNLVRCPELRSVRFSEVDLALQLSILISTSVTRSLSVVERLSASRRVPVIGGSTV